MKITVLGCGALGQLWLTALCKQGHEVQGWLRVPQPYCSVNLVETDGSIFNESLTANDPDFLATSDLLLVTLKDKIPAEQWQDKRVVWDARVKLLSSQGPGTAIDFGLKIIDLLVGREKAHEVASQLVMAAGIYNYYE